MQEAPVWQQISIHALREEGDAPAMPTVQLAGQFLSTPSARRATGFSPNVLQAHRLFLSTPSARRATAALFA